jgi:excisionase family DNA binding protein
MSLTPQSHTESPLLTTDEACDYLKISRTSLYQLAKKGLIAAIHPVSGRTAYLKTDLDTYIATRRFT